MSMPWYNKINIQTYGGDVSPSRHMTNIYKGDADMKSIPLTNGMVTFIDDEDFDFLNQWTWSASYRGKYYAVRYEKRKKVIHMHRVIMNTPHELEVDHIDGNGLNNIKSNLRNVTHKENLRNLKRKKNNTSGFTGVWPCCKKFRATITVDGKAIHLGLFNTDIEAAKAYDHAARKYFGKYARLNLED